MTATGSTLVCKRLMFCSLKDEEAFFEWSSTIKSIEKVSVVGDELFFNLTSETLPDEDFLAVAAMSERYGIGTAALRVLSDCNKRHRMLKTLHDVQEAEPAENDMLLVCKNLVFYSSQDREIFCEWIKKIKCIKEIFLFNKVFYLKLIAPCLCDDDLRDLIALFYRYNLDMKQFQSFLTPDNYRWFHNKQAFWYQRVCGVQAGAAAQEGSV